MDDLLEFLKKEIKFGCLLSKQSHQLALELELQRKPIDPQTSAVVLVCAILLLDFSVQGQENPSIKS